MKDFKTLLSISVSSSVSYYYCDHLQQEELNSLCSTMRQNGLTADVLLTCVFLTDMFVCFVSEPNNESPLNTAAAELWDDQEGEKQLLLHHLLPVQRDA